MAEQRGVVVRFRGKELGCEGCLRITVGTEDEVDRFLEETAAVLKDIHGRGLKDGQGEEKAEMRANGVIS